MYKKNLDKVFQDALHDVPIAPSDQAWRKIANAMDWRKARPFYRRLHFWLAMGLLLSTVILLADTPFSREMGINSNKMKPEGDFNIPQETLKESLSHDLLHEKVTINDQEEVEIVTLSKPPIGEQVVEATKSAFQQENLPKDVPNTEKKSVQEVEKMADIKELSLNENTASEEIETPIQPIAEVKPIGLPSPKEMKKQLKRKRRRVKVVINLKPQEWPQTEPERKKIFLGKLFQEFKKIPIKNN